MASGDDVMLPKSNFGAGQLVICTGKEISRKTRPTSAGLKGFFPRPPKDIFPMPMDIKAPISNIQIGRLLGTLKASNIPVTRADPSFMVTGPLIRYFWISHSKKRHASDEINSTRNASSPKK